MNKSGLADNPLFSVPSDIYVSTTPPSVESIPLKKKNIGRINSKKEKEFLTTSNRDTMQPLNHDTMTPRYHDTIIELVRRAVKEFGKEAATHRFTQEEKKAIADIIYTYKNRRVKTSENEITRIAVNFISQDYKENGESSVLDRTLKALHE